MVDDVPDPRPESNRSQKWVVGVDGSESSHHAALWASANIEHRASELQLASAWSMPVSMAMTPMTPVITTSTIDAISEAAEGRVSDLARDLAPAVDVPITTSVGQSGATSLLLDAAHHCELVVVGSRGRGGFARLMLGSTSTQCATHSSAPVAVIPLTAPATRPHSIAVAFDGSPNAVAALEWAAEFADVDSVIDCVFVWDTTPIAVGSDQFFFPEASDLARERFEHLVSEVTQAQPQKDINVRSVFVEGAPRAALAAATASCDLLVMGARGHGAIGAAMLGSVSTWLLHHVHQAMVVVPQHQLDGEVDDRDIEQED
jgi:nucleotide-binding universal stress UspA family protein